MNERIGIVCLTIAVVVVIAGVVLYNIRLLDYQRTAIEHGCMVNSGGVICPQGDRK